MPHESVAPAADASRAIDALERAVACAERGAPDRPVALISAADLDALSPTDIRPHLEAYINEFLTRDPAMMTPPGYSTVESIKRVRSLRGYRNVRQTMEEVLDKGIVIIGSPNTVREKLAAAQDRGKFNISLTKTQFGTMPHQLVRENQIAIAEEILPYFRDRAPQPARMAAE